MEHDDWQTADRRYSSLASMQKSQRVNGRPPL